MNASQRPLIGAVVAILVSLPASVHAQSPTLTFVWSAPPPCPGREAVLDHIEAILGRKAAPASALAVDAVVDTRPDGTVRVSLSASGASAPGQRTFEAESCSAAADATALIVALLIDPALGATALPPSVPAPPAPPAMPAPEASRPPPPLATAPVLAETPARAEPRRLSLAARAALAGDIGTVGSANVGGEVAVLGAWRHVRVELVGSYWAPSTATAAGRSDEGASLKHGAAGARAGYDIERGRMMLTPFVAAEVDWVTGSGFGGQEQLTETATWGALGGGLVAAWRIGGGVSVAVGILGLVPGARPAFVASSSADGTATTIQRPSSVVARTFVGVEYLFF